MDPETVKINARRLGEIHLIDEERITVGEEAKTDRLRHDSPWINVGAAATRMQPAFTRTKVEFKLLEDRKNDRLLPFEIFFSKNGLHAEPGLLHTTPIGITSETLTFPSSDTTWYLEAHIEINQDTGAVVGSEVYWTETPNVTDGADIYSAIGEISIIDGFPDPLTLIQNNYGPLILFLHGGVAAAWEGVII